MQKYKKPNTVGRGGVKRSWWSRVRVSYKKRVGWDERLSYKNYLGICSEVGQRREVIFIPKQQEKEDILVFLQI